MASSAASWFAIIDGAQDQRLAALVTSCATRVCLFKGDIDPRLADVAPWLVRIEPSEPLLPTWQQHGLGHNWGLMALSDLPLDRLRTHFRRFLQAKLPDGTIAMFRFYDPRVFHTMIRSATPEERAPWFNGVLQYAVEAENGVLCNYRLRGEALLDGDVQVA